MAYRFACLQRNLRTVAVCCLRTKGWSPVVRSSLLSIQNPRARTNLSRDGVAMVGARRPISSAVPSNARCSTRSGWCLEALARASQIGGLLRFEKNLF